MQQYGSSVIRNIVVLYMDVHLWNQRPGKLVLHFIKYPYKLEQDTDQCFILWVKKKTSVDQLIKKKKGELEVNEVEKTWTLNTFVSFSEWNIDK